METLYKSKPLKIGKHEWRIVVKPFQRGGHCLEYQWRPAAIAGTPEAHRPYWRCSTDWPRWSDHDPHCGLPKTLEKLYFREIRELDKHLSHVGRMSPQLELFNA